MKLKMKRIYFIATLLVAFLMSCADKSNATVSDIENACKKKDWDNAKKMCEAYIKKDKSNPLVYKYLGDAYLGLKDSSFALYSYDQAISLDSAYIDALVCSADIYMNSGAAPKAIARLRSQLEYLPDNPVLINALGCAFSLTGNENEARANFERAVSVDPSYSRARINLALSFIDHNEYDDAIVNLETVIDEDPNNSDAYNYLGYALALSDNYEEAEKMFLKSISIDENNTSALENIAYYYKSRGQLDKAKAYYQKAAALGSENAKNILKSASSGK